ncbi:hypothetical protein J2787_004056 [Chryseobacterium rhizosphaerae]|uniref:Uncharacterized protein n=1 Tax=Chryseobacterium rhizosphaerae TaxID=395937 RepID=A0AAE4C5I8_9FLAO|nr:hypothetical protein [Chryseobacterium rhizosphaerae]
MLTFLIFIGSTLSVLYSDDKYSITLLRNKNSTIRNPMVLFYGVRSNKLFFSKPESKIYL